MITQYHSTKLHSYWWRNSHCWLVSLVLQSYFVEVNRNLGYCRCCFCCNKYVDYERISMKKTNHSVCKKMLYWKYFVQLCYTYQIIWNSFSGEYARTCIGDSCEEVNETNESCDVYVWGSNSSHQLAEGTQDKILSPKLTHAFSSVQQVCVGGMISSPFMCFP